MVFLIMVVCIDVRLVLVKFKFVLFCIYFLYVVKG